METAEKKDDSIHIENKEEIEDETQKIQSKYNRRER